MNIVDIELLPEIDSLQDTDKLYVLSKRDGGWKKNEISVMDLSSFFYEPALANQIMEKYSDLMKLSAEFVDFLKTNYPTAEYISSHYSKKDYFLDIYNQVPTTSTVVSTDLADYVTISQGAYAKAQSLKNHEMLKLEYQKSASNSAMEMVKETDV